MQRHEQGATAAAPPSPTGAAGAGGGGGAASRMTGSAGATGASQGGGGGGAVSKARWQGDTGRTDHVGAGRNGKRLAAAGGASGLATPGAIASICAVHPSEGALHVAARAGVFWLEDVMFLAKLTCTSVAGMGSAGPTSAAEGLDETLEDYQKACAAPLSLLRLASLACGVRPHAKHTVDTRETCTGLD